MGHVGRFSASDATRYPRGSRVVVRTPRGLESGHVLRPPGDENHAAAADGSILRGMTVEDDLLDQRLQKNRDEAYRACVALLQERRLPATLVDVETLFDGSGLFFYFLGELRPEVEALTSELAEVYEANVEIRRFAEVLTDGCGPGCGTESASGEACGTCTTCVVAGACGVRKE